MTAPAKPRRAAKRAVVRRKPTNELDVAEIRSKVYGLDLEMSGHRLVYLDAAATSQRLKSAIDAMTELHRNENANIHQEGFALARQAKKSHSNAREAVAKYIGVTKPEEVVWTHGTTESINLVMTTWGLDNVKRG